MRTKEKEIFNIIFFTPSKLIEVKYVGRRIKADIELGKSYWIIPVYCGCSVDSSQTGVSSNSGAAMPQFKLVVFKRDFL